MRNRLLYILILVVLSGGLAGQYYWLQTIPLPDENVVRHEASHYRMVNLSERNSFYNTFEKLADHAKHSARAKTRTTYEAAMHTEQSLKMVLALLDKAYSYDEVDQHYLNDAKRMHDQELALVRPYTARTYEFIKLEDHAPDEDFLVLDLCRRESHFIQNYVQAMDLYYDECCNAAIDRFYNVEILLSPIGYKYFADTIEVFKPSVMKRNVIEQIEITANKKYFDKVIDSLKHEGVIAHDDRPYYRGVVRLIGDDLSIERRSSDSQVISELEYTTWRFGVSAKKKGTKRVKAEIGVVVIDGAGRKNVVYVPIEVGVVEVL